MTSPTDANGTTDAAVATPPTSHGAPWGKLGAIVLGLCVIVPLMLLAFVTPSINSGPEDLPLALSGPEQITSQIQSTLDEAQPGAFEVTTYDSAAEVTAAVQERDAIGGITVGADGAFTITTASGAGTPYSTLLTTIGAGLTQQGASVTYDDVAPLTADDPSGVGIGSLGLPLAFGGMISAVLLSNLLKGRPWMRVLGSLTASVAVGFVAIAILQFGFGSVDGNYVTTSLSLALGMAAISVFVLGMESLLGMAGLGIGAVLIMFVGNPISGLQTGWQWLPSPWGFIGQLLPPGAAGTLLRSDAYFAGNGGGMAIIVLSAWVLVGIVLVALSTLRKKRSGEATHVATPAAA